MTACSVTYSFGDPVLISATDLLFESSFNLEDEKEIKLNSFPKIPSVRIIRSGFMNGFSLVHVAINPVISTNEGTIIYTNLDFEIHYKPDESGLCIGMPSANKRSIETAFNLARSLVRNPNDLDFFYSESKTACSSLLFSGHSVTFPPVSGDPAIDYIFITNRLLKPYCEKFLYLEKLGFRTVIITIEDITSTYSGSDTPEK
jgi:hypothetical protein